MWVIGFAVTCMIIGTTVAAVFVYLFGGEK